MNNLLNRRRSLMGYGGVEVQPDDEIWYDADTKLTLHSEAIVISHTFFNGRGILKLSSNPTNATYWFQGVTAVTKVYLPNRITRILDYAFTGCSGLRDIKLPSGLMTTGTGAFRSCSSLTEIILPDSFTNMGNNSFQHCSGLTKVVLSSNLTTIAAGAFNGCSSLTNIKLPNGVTKIGGSAFNSCTHLMDIEIPDSITSIDTFAFGNSNAFTSFKIFATTPPSLGDRPFLNTGFKIYVPDSAVETYKADAAWSTYASRIHGMSELPD